MYSGKVSVKENICNISKKLGYLGVSYSQVQGYDINSSNGKHFFCKYCERRARYVIKI